MRIYNAKNIDLIKHLYLFIMGQTQEFRTLLECIDGIE